MEISIGSDPWFFLYTVNIRLRKKVITRELLGFKRSLLYEKLSKNQELLEFAIYFIIRRHRDDETTRRPDTPKKLHLLVYFFLFSRYPHTEGFNRNDSFFLFFATLVADSGHCNKMLAFSTKKALLDR